MATSHRAPGVRLAGGRRRHLKDKALEFGADIVGICDIEPSDVYRGRSSPRSMPSPSGSACGGANFRWCPRARRPSSACGCISPWAKRSSSSPHYVRSLGYACKVEHPIGDSDLLHIPIGLKAGFGELGRHGSIIHPRLGPLFRMGSVTTSIELAIDHPIDAGIAKFCDTCRACRKSCPPGAIPDERSPEAGKDHLGNDRYVVDTGRCFPYFAKHSYCSICLPVCVYNHKEWARDFEGAQTQSFPQSSCPRRRRPPICRTRTGVMSIRGFGDNEHHALRSFRARRDLGVLRRRCVATAQPAVATLAGRVVDTQLAATPGATVRVRSLATSNTWTATSDERGRFSLPMLPPGAYGIEVSLTGFAPWRAEAVTLQVGQQRQLDIQL